MNKFWVALGLIVGLSFGSTLAQAEDLLAELGDETAIRIIKNIEHQLREETLYLENIYATIGGQLIINKGPEAMEQKALFMEADIRAPQRTFAFYRSIARQLRRVTDLPTIAKELADTTYFYTPPSHMEGMGKFEFAPLPEEYKEQFAEALITNEFVQRGDLYLPITLTDKSKEAHAASIKTLAILGNNGSIKYTPVLYFKTHAAPSATAREKTPDSIRQTHRIIIENGLSLPVVTLELNLNLKKEPQTCEIIGPPPYWTVDLHTNLFFDAEYKVEQIQFCSSRKGCSARCGDQKTSDHEQCTKIRLDLKYWFSLPRIEAGSEKGVSFEIKDRVLGSGGTIERYYDICTMD